MKQSQRTSSPHSEWRLDVKVRDRRMLKKFLELRGESYASLATKVGCSKATIGHLVTGQTTSTRPVWAKAIEEKLDAPQGSLFVAKVSRVSQDTEQAA